MTVLQNAARGAAKPLRRHHQAGPWSDRDQLRRARDAKKFADSRGITFPLISDPGSAIIKRYGLLNDTVDPKSRTYGIPHPGTFILDRKGVVRSRFFEDAYQERYTAATILSTLGAGVDGGAMSADTAHLTLTASISDTVAAPGERLAITVNVTPKPGMHLYAPGKHDYQVVQLTLDPQPWLRLQATDLSCVGDLSLQAAR